MRSDPTESTWQGSLADSYDDINYGRSLAGTVLRRSHQLVETPFGPDVHFDRVLEVGAGSGVHLPFVRHRYRQYVMTDGSVVMLRRGQARHPAPQVMFSVDDARCLSFPDGSFDRVIAAHVLEHLCEPHKVLREWVRVLRPGGTLSLVLPADPGLLWRFGRTLGPRRRALAAGLPYDYLMATEHINSINNLVALIEYYFDDVKSLWWPLRFPLSDLNLVYVANIKV